MATELKRAYDIPVSARGIDHYRDAFPGVLDNPLDRILVIGSGLSDITLLPNVVSIDPEFKNPDHMSKLFYAHPYNLYQHGNELPALEALNNMGHTEQNSSFISAQARADLPLPLPLEHFDHIISSSLILGGFELANGGLQTIHLITNLILHTRQGGKISLHPYLHTLSPNISDNPQVPENLLTIQMFQLHQQIFGYFQHIGLCQPPENGIILADEPDQPLHTLTISLP